METELGTWDSVLLEHLTEDNFIHNIQQRYEQGSIYTYIGTSLVAVNPHHLLLENTDELIENYGSKGIFQLPPHIYGLANWVYQTLQQQNTDQCIFLNGESCSGKTECFKKIINFLIRVQNTNKDEQMTSTHTVNCCTTSMANTQQSSSIFCTPAKHRQCYPSSCATNTSSGKETMICKGVQCDIMTQSPQLSPILRFQRLHRGSCERNSIISGGLCTPNVRRSYRSSSQIYKSLSQRCTNCQLEMSKAKSMHKSANDLNVNIHHTHHFLRDKTYGTNYNCNLTTQRPTCCHMMKNCSTGNLLNQWNHYKSTTHIDQSKIMEKGCDSYHQLQHKNLSSCSNRATFRFRTHSLEKENDHEFIRNSANKKVFYSTAKHDGLDKLRQSKESCCCSDRQRSLSDHFKKEPRHFSELHLANNNNFDRDEHQDFSNYCGCQCRIAFCPIENIHLNNSSSNLAVIKMRECLWYADLLLEAMGNAFTIGNNNASRFGKLFDIEIDFKGDIIGLQIMPYMLEKGRLTNVPHGERNFHIFYQLLLTDDLQLLKSLKLYRNLEKYELLKNSSATESDFHNFLYTQKALAVLGFDADDTNAIFCVLGAILKLGNIIFVPITNIDSTEACQISNNYEIEEIAYLLHLNADDLAHALITQRITYKTNDDVAYDLDAAQASSLRQRLCRTLYGRLFTWLVTSINRRLRSTQTIKRHLTILDFYGFQSIFGNQFDQLIINYSAERIHQQFIRSTLRSEQELYVREGLEWTHIDYFDNESICELIDRPHFGILSLMNESHLSSDEALLERIRQCCAGHANFMLYQSATTNTNNMLMFRIRHYARVVNYSINGFLHKNYDHPTKFISSLFYRSECHLLQELFPDGQNLERSVLLIKKKPITESSNVRNHLQTILTTIQNYQKHYIFCLRPNDCHRSHFFDLALVQHQVRYMSLMPLVNLYRIGHCYHLSHEKFLMRYKLLNSRTWPHYNGESLVEGIALILHGLPLPLAEFTIGIRHVFVRSPRAVYELEEFRKVRLNDLAVLVQSVFRKYRAQAQWKRIRRSQMIISRFWRYWKRRRENHLVFFRNRLEWAVNVITHHYRLWKIRQYLYTIWLRLPENTLSPLSLEWPTVTSGFLVNTSRLLYEIYHRWRCQRYRNTFDQTARNRMREKVTASIIFKDRKSLYPESVSCPFVGDYVHLRQNAQWKKICMETNDQYVVFADIINKISRTNGRTSNILLVLSTVSLLLLDHKTLQIKYRIPATEIYRMSLSPYYDDIAVFHIKMSEIGLKKGDFVFQTIHVIEVVTKLFLVIQNAVGNPPNIHICTEFDANFGQQNVTLSFRRENVSEIIQREPKIVRKSNRMEIIL